MATLGTRAKNNRKKIFPPFLLPISFHLNFEALVPRVTYGLNGASALPLINQLKYHIDTYKIREIFSDQCVWVNSNSDSMNEVFSVFSE